MKRISTTLALLSSLALAFAVSACGSDAEPTEEETADQSSDITEAEAAAVQAKEHAGLGGTTTVTHGAELGGSCVTCGPLPDPWKKEGPLPDPWKSTGGGGGGGAGTTTTGTGSSGGQN